MKPRYIVLAFCLILALFCCTACKDKYDDRQKDIREMMAIEFTPREYAKRIFRLHYANKILIGLAKRNNRNPIGRGSYVLQDYWTYKLPKKIDESLVSIDTIVKIQSYDYYFIYGAGNKTIPLYFYKIAVSTDLDYYLLEGFDVDNFYRMMSDMTNDFRYAKTLEKTIQMVNQIYITPNINQSVMLTEDEQIDKYRPIKTEQDSIITYKFYMKRVDSASGKIEPHRLEIDHKNLRIRIDGTDIVHQSEKLNLPISQRE
jgi:hypothetical protein